MIDIGRLQFDFSNPWLLVLGVVLLGSLLMSSRGVLRRLFHRSPLRTVLVLFLNLVAYTAVFLLLLEPRISHDGTRSVILVTEGAEQDNSRLEGIDRVYVAPGVIASPGVRRNLASAGWLLDAGQLKLREPALNAIEVRGYGLGPEQWHSIADGLNIAFEPPGINGFTATRWQRFLAEGETLHVSGYYRGSADEVVMQLRLLDPAGNTAAETRLKNGQGFSLAARVKTRGLLDYRLQAWDGEILQSEQILPLQAGQGNTLSIMVEQSAPSYETRQLKDFAAASGHRVRINSDISKGKYISQSVNLPADTDTTFSPAVLASQDVLIMDGRAFAALPATRMQWLETAVENGLGLLVLADSILLEQFGNIKTGLLQGFSLVAMNDTGTPVIPGLPNAGARDWQEPVETAAMQLSASDADVLIVAGDGRDLVVKRADGLGQVGISLISHSHAWLTAGQRAQWSDYWSALLSALARQRSDSFLLKPAETEFSRVGQRTAVCAFAEDRDIHILVFDNQAGGRSDALELQPAPDTLDSPRQCAFFWPTSAGWHRIQLRSGPDGSVLDEKAIYVFSADQWLAQQREQRVEATRIRVAESGAGSFTTPDSLVTEPMGVFWLWLTLVLAAALLWLERKLDFV